MKPAEKRFLEFKGQIKLSKVEEFIVGDFFEELSENGIRLRFDKENNFLNWIVNPMKKMKLSLIESVLYDYQLIEKADDTDMQSYFLPQKPIISVRIFLPQLKALLEDQLNYKPKEYGLDTKDGNTNLFNVDLSGISDNRVVAVRVRKGREDHQLPEQHIGEWLVFAVPLNFGHPRTVGCSFFSPI